MTLISRIRTLEYTKLPLRLKTHQEEGEREREGERTKENERDRGSEQNTEK